MRVHSVFLSIVVALYLHQQHQGMEFSEYIRSMFASAPANHWLCSFLLTAVLLIQFDHLFSSGIRSYHRLSLSLSSKQCCHSPVVTVLRFEHSWLDWLCPVVTTQG